MSSLMSQIPHEPNLALHIGDLTVAYHDKPVLWGIDINVPPGVLAGVIGPNGAGKPALIKAVSGLVKPSAGHIYLHGEPYVRQRKRVGYVPQRSVDWDFPTTAHDVVAIVAETALLVIALFWKEFKLLYFDPQFGASLGFSRVRLELLLSSTLAFAIVTGWQLVGVVLMAAMATAPAAAAWQ